MSCGTQAVCALAYLESQRYVIHRAVATDSFLVASDDRLIKLSHFEHARRVADDDYLVCVSTGVISVSDWDGLAHGRPHMGANGVS